MPSVALSPHNCLLPDWPPVAGVQAIFTTRQGGCSAAPFDSLNLGAHVGDAPQAVASNRQAFAACLSHLAQRPVVPQFLQQVHGWQVCTLPVGSNAVPTADACVTAQAGWACTIMVADCLPLVLAHRNAGVVGAAHAGWRGLAGGADGVGVVEALWQAYCQQVRTQQHAAGVATSSTAAIAAATQVWLGPCIGPQAFEVGSEVRQAFTAHHHSATACFTAREQVGKWWADLPALARLRWQALGVDALYGNDSSAAWCTASNPLRFFSHRRDAAALGSTGRMAVAIWRV